MPNAFILVAEDDALTRELLVNVLHREGHRVAQAATGVEAVEHLRGSRFDLVVSDIQMPGASGLDILSHVARTSPNTPVILVTGYAAPDAAMDAISQGAVDYLGKPLDVLALRAAVGRALERQRLTKENLELRSNVIGPKRLIGTSPAMLELYKQIAHVAPTEAPVLLHGESGSGKELVARTLHERSRRASGPFVVFRCGALAEGVLESELFGYEKAAFAGAPAPRPGVFEQAHGGTLLLDEVGDVPMKLQAPLLRVLQDGEVRRAGGSEPIKVDARLVAATHRDLAADVAAGRMRQDLFYLLNVVSVQVPALRERGDDLVELARHFVVRHAAAFGRAIPDIAPETLLQLRSYAWPGNVRELDNALARAVALSPRAVVMPEDLPVEIARPGSLGAGAGIDSDWPTVDVLQGRYIQKVMARAGGNKTLAANILGMDRRTIQRLFKRVAQKK